VFGGGSYRRGGCLTCRERFAQQGPAQREQLTTPPIGQESEVADAREAFRQDVLEKAAQKLFVSQSHYAAPVVMSVVLPTECYVRVGHVDDPVVGDRYSMGVASQILQNVLGSAKGWFGVDYPVLAKQRAQKLGERFFVR
jgi:hypothetical protein